MTNLGLLGCATMPANTIASKADALQYAINTTATYGDNGVTVNYEEAQKLFDLINSNVQLPDVPANTTDKALGLVSDLFEGLKAKAE